MHSLCNVLYVPCLSVIPALGMHIPSISKFHWPGYYICFHALLLLVLVLLVFSDRWNDIVRTKGEKATTCLKKKLPIPYYVSFLLLKIHYNCNFKP